MIVWINGAFGSGKTQTADELARRLASAHVADPELIGLAINKTVPRAQRGDFQDRPQWRAAVVATLAQIDAVDPRAVTVVPMTLVDLDYFDEIVGELRRTEIDVRHITLQASPATLERRLRGRTPPIASTLFSMDESWALAQIPRCTAALSDPAFAHHLPTDDLAPDDVVEAVADVLDLALARGRSSSLTARARRLWVTASHIRL